MDSLDRLTTKWVENALEVYDDGGLWEFLDSLRSGDPLNGPPGITFQFDGRGENEDIEDEEHQDYTFAIYMDDASLGGEVCYYAFLSRQGREPTEEDAFVRDGVPWAVNINSECIWDKKTKLHKKVEKLLKDMDKKGLLDATSW